MTLDQLNQAMAQLGYAVNVDYTIDTDYSSIQMINPDVAVPSEQSLQDILDRLALGNRVQALGDIAILLDAYFKANASQIHGQDSWNIAGFSTENFNSSFGWIFEELPKPTIDQLETIKASL